MNIIVLTDGVKLQRKIGWWRETATEQESIEELPKEMTKFIYRKKVGQGQFKELGRFDYNVGCAITDLPPWLISRIKFKKLTNDSSSVNINLLYSYMLSKKTECIKILLSSAYIKMQLPAAKKAFIASFLSEKITELLLTDFKFMDLDGYDHLFMMELKVSVKTLKNMIKKTSETFSFVVKNYQGNSKSLDVDCDCYLFFNTDPNGNLYMALCTKENVKLKDPSQTQIIGDVNIKDLLFIVSPNENIRLSIHSPKGEVNIVSELTEICNKIIAIF